MTQPELKELLQAATANLKHATAFAEALKDQPVRAENATTLEQISMRAMAAVTTLRSAASGNPPPSRG